MSESVPNMQNASRAGIAWGVLTLIIGILAIGAPLVSGIAVSVTVAVLLIVAGLAQLVWAFAAPSFGRGFVTFVFGGFSLIAGLVMLARPLLGLASLTMILAAYFLVDGVGNVFLAFRMRPTRGWVWMLICGIATIALGWMIWSDWPLSGAWAIGVLVGVRLILAGWTMILLGTSARALAGASAA